MKHHSRLYTFFILSTLIIIIVNIEWISHLKSTPENQILLKNSSHENAINLNKSPQKTPPQKPAPRRSITFIMGEDKDPDNRYYQEAYQYYRYNPKAKTDDLVTYCRSLLDLRNYLRVHRPEDGQAWGTVNIVLHSNEWSGAGIPVLPDGKRTSVQSVEAAMKSGAFAPLADEIMDEQTELVLYGCALGRNQELLDLIEIAFGGQDERRPIVRSSRYFVFYESKMYNGVVENSERYLTDFSYAFYKKGYRPGDIRLSRQLQKRYPTSTVNWRDALTHTQPEYLGDAYHYTFDVPIVWTVTYADKSERPVLKTKEEQEKWLANQPELQAKLQAYHIPIEQFQWTFRKLDYTFEDGTTEPAIKAIGLCTVLCVLQTIMEEKEGEWMPVLPALTDKRYYATSRQQVMKTAEN